MLENIENNNTLGLRIRKIRKEKGLSLHEFGKLIGANKGNVSLWENGKVKPNNERLKAIADLANITVDGLLYGYKDLDDYASQRILAEEKRLIEDGHELNIIKWTMSNVYMSYFNLLAPTISEQFESREDFDEHLKKKIDESIEQLSNPITRQTFLLGKLWADVSRDFELYLNAFYKSTYEDIPPMYNMGMVEEMSEDLFDDVRRLKTETLYKLDKIEEEYKDLIDQENN